MVLASSSKIILLYIWGVISGPCSLYHGLCVCFYASSTLFDYCSLVVCLKSRSMRPPAWRVYFEEQIFLMLVQSYYQFLKWITLLMLYLRSICLTQDHKDFLLCFLYKCGSMQVYTYVCNPFGINFYMWHSVWIGVHFFAYGSGIICWKDYPFFTVVASLLK